MNQGDIQTHPVSRTYLKSLTSYRTQKKAAERDR